MAAMKDKHDSGVGLTQQPSRQTMRVLQSSHSDEQFDSDDRAPGSLLSQIRSNTSASDTSYAEDSNSQPPIESSRQDEKQSMMGNIMGDVQMKDQDTVSFLAGASKSSSTADGASDDVEVFLSPDGVFESSGVPSFTSPLTSLSSNSASFGVSSNFTSNRQSQINDKSRFFGDRPVTMASVELSQSNEDGHQPGVIIDSNGLTHILTVEEEAQRKLDLQQAVMAKMSAGAVGPNSNAAPESPQQASTHTIPPPTLQSIPSRLQNSCSFRSKTSTWETLSSPKKPSIFQKIAGFFRKRRAPEQAY
ncbi:hypothetical protein BDV29DRAFT_166365 [Aspergillus leporis]|uniref:Uncharacterized protein n=1 Tax=Aspergillus leporis TaxID=41062 RepID=A0A5N5XGD4_9EURO|nr:hypothetical protein BDV29DRAFT_166365 [Aspergillus leporis]